MRKTLTTMSVAALKAPERGQYDVWDKRQPGFGVRVSYGGARTWILMYRVGGIKRRLTLGQFPQMGLADARLEARRRLGEVASGNDPAQQKADAKAEGTFADLAELYLERHARVHNKPRTVHEVEKLLAADLLPAWGNRKLSSIGRKDVIAMLDNIVARGAPIAANRARAVISAIFGFAMDRELIDAHPAYRIRQPAPEHSRDRVLSDDEIRQFWQALDGEPVRIAAGFKLVLLTAARSSEVFGVSWSELDLDAGWWTLAAERSKNGKTHRIPLVASAIGLLRTLRNESGGSGLVIPGGSDGRRARALTAPRTWLAALRRKAGLDYFTTHDLRRTVASKLTELGIPRLTVSKLLNHAESGVTYVYDRHSYDPEKRGALFRWERRLNEIAGGVVPVSNVVAFHG